MSDISVGPAQNSDGQKSTPNASASMDAQEAKPFDEAGQKSGTAETSPHHKPGDSQTATDEPNYMISGRRNGGRDDASDAPPESEARSDGEGEP